VLIDHKGEGIDLDGDALVLRWPDAWSTDASRRALSPRRIPLTAVSHVEVIERANSIRVHLHGQDPAQTFSPATSVNAVSVPTRQIESAKAFAADVNALLDTVPDIVDPSLTRPVTQQVQDARRGGLDPARSRPSATSQDDSSWQSSATPAERARVAKMLGHRWHEYVGTAESTYPGLGDQALASRAAVTGMVRDSHLDVISQIEREGWELVHVDHVRRGARSITDELFSTGDETSTTGDIVGVYLFRAVDEAPPTDQRWTTENRSE
jgi:hypothetical protein